MLLIKLLLRKIYKNSQHKDYLQEHEGKTTLMPTQISRRIR